MVHDKVHFYFKKDKRGLYTCRASLGTFEATVQKLDRKTAKKLALKFLVERMQDKSHVCLMEHNNIELVLRHVERYNLSRV